MCKRFICAILMFFETYKTRALAKIDRLALDRLTRAQADELNKVVTLSVTSKYCIRRNYTIPQGCCIMILILQTARICIIKNTSITNLLKQKCMHVAFPFRSTTHIQVCRQRHGRLLGQQRALLLQKGVGPASAGSKLADLRLVRPGPREHACRREWQHAAYAVRVLTALYGVGYFRININNLWTGVTRRLRGSLG